MPESIVQTNCVVGSLLPGPGSGIAVVSGEGAGTGDCLGVTGGVITVGDDGAGSGEDEGTVSGTDGEAGAVPGDAGVQPAASNNSRPKIMPMHLIFMPSVPFMCFLAL